MKTIVTLFLLAVFQVNACVCSMEKFPYTLSYNLYSAVFTGYLISAEDVAIEGYTYRKYIFSVSENFKYPNESNQKTIYSLNSDCQMDYVKGSEWLVSAYGPDTFLQTDICCNNKKAASIERNEINLLRSYLQIKEGKWYYDGVINAEGKLVNGKPEGNWFYYLDGFPYASITYKDGVFDGLYREYYVPINQFKDFMPNNPSYLFFYTNKYLFKLKKEISYKKGVMEVEKIYSMVGLLSVKNYSAGKSNGVQQEFDQYTGFIRTYYSVKNGRLDGLKIDYNRTNGAANLISLYENGKVVGKCKLFDSTGNFIADVSSERIVYNKSLELYVIAK